MPDSPTQGFFTDSVIEVHGSSSSRCEENSANPEEMDQDESVVVVDDSPKRQPIPVIDLTSPEHDSDIVTSTPNTVFSSEISSSRDRSETNVLMRRLHMARNRLAELRARRIEQLEIFPRSESVQSIPRFLQEETPSEEARAEARGHLSNATDALAYRLQEARSRFADLRARRERAIDLFLSTSPRSAGRISMPSRTHRRRGRYTPYNFAPLADDHPSSTTSTTDPQPPNPLAETFPLNHASPITVPDDDTPTIIDVDGSTTGEDTSQEEEEEEIAVVNENIARIAQETRDAIARARNVANRARETLERAQFDQERVHTNHRRVPAPNAATWNGEEMYPPNVVHDGPIPQSPPLFLRQRRRFGRPSSASHFPDMLLPFISVFGHAPPPLHHFGEAENRGSRDEYEALWNLSERIGQAKPRGLSKTDIERICSFRYNATSKNQSNGSCVVCMMDYVFREKLRRLPCSHDFHSKCIDRWLKSNRTCPICRDEVKV